MIRCFGDTFFYLAFLNDRDEAHQKSIEFIAEHDPQIVTTAWVLTEVADAMAVGGRTMFGEFLYAMEADGRTEIVSPSRPLFDAGIQLYLARPDKEWPLTD